MDDKSSNFIENEHQKKDKSNEKIFLQSINEYNDEYRQKCEALTKQTIAENVKLKEIWDKTMYEYHDLQADLMVFNVDFFR